MTGGQRVLTGTGFALFVIIGARIWLEEPTRSSRVSAQPEHAASNGQTLVERFTEAANIPSGNADAPGQVTSNQPEKLRGRASDRKRADAIREQLREKVGARAQQPASAVGSMPQAPPDPVRAAARERLTQQVREQYFPMVRACYETLLEKSPKAAGKFVLEFAIVGDASVGGVVDRVALADGTTLTDPTLLECLKESLYAALFDPPPEGASETTVVFPIELAP